MCKHEFTKIAEQDGGDYEATQSVFWCKKCGTIRIIESFDGRNYRDNTYTPESNKV